MVVYDSYSKWWFLPKGRKDVGESVEVAAVRESFEEVKLDLLVQILPCC